MKKIVIYLMLIGLLTGCGSKEKETTKQEDTVADSNQESMPQETEINNNLEIKVNNFKDDDNKTYLLIKNINMSKEEEYLGSIKVTGYGEDNKECGTKEISINKK